MKFVRPLILLLVLSPIVATQLGGGCVSTPTDSSSDRDGSGRGSIPRDARIVDEGTGRITYTAKDDGRLWLYDADDRMLIDARNVRRGQEYVALIDQNKAQLDGKKVVDEDLKRKHVHRIYYLPDDPRYRDHDDDNYKTNYRLPERAEVVADATGELNYRVRDSGRVWVFDAEDDRMVHTQTVRKDERVVVTPDRDRITIGGRTAFSGNLVRDHVHRIYFARE